MPFRRMIIKNTLLETLKGTAYAAVVLWLDHFLIMFLGMMPVEKNIFAPCIIGGIGIAGVILGLYCSNVAAIYSTRYANAPSRIANAFQGDSLTRRCILGIVDYIVFGLVVLSIAMLKSEISCFLVAVSVIWTITVIVSYSIAGNRTYQLSVVYNIAADANRLLYRIITKRINQRLFVTDDNFQNHFMEVAEKQIELLKSIQNFGNSEERNDYASMTEFMCNNLALVRTYWTHKKEISRSSMWFRNTPKYQKWHMTSDAESSLALQTGTSLRAKEEHYYWWFEDEMFSINKACVNNLIEHHDYASLYTYFLAFDSLCKTAIECKEANIFAANTDWLSNMIERCIPSDNINKESKEVFVGLVEILSLLYLDLILETGKFYQEFDFQTIVLPILSSIDKGEDFDKSKVLRGRENKEYYEKIITEVKAEGKRVTPDWVIKQQVAKEEYVYLNSLLDIVREGVNHAFKLGKIFLDHRMHFEACIIYTRYFEYESKLARLVDIVEHQKKDLEKYHVDKALIWDEFRLDELRKTMSEWKKAVPALLSDCSLLFTLHNWDNSEDYPDFLGESYNHICEDAVDAIISNDRNQFKIDYENLSKLMLLYQEYIRSDFIRKKNLYRIEYAYYMFTSPIVEWAQIGGLAILWGEFHSDSEWKDCVHQGADPILVKDSEKTELPEKLIEYIQHRNHFMLGIASRDILETGWKLRVSNAIQESGICEVEYVNMGRSIKTDSKLIKAFCSSFLEIGFSIDPSEVFWVMCVNPLLSDEKKFRASHSWDKEIIAPDE